MSALSAENITTLGRDHLAVRALLEAGISFAELLALSPNDLSLIAREGQWMIDLLKAGASFAKLSALPPDKILAFSDPEHRDGLRTLLAQVSFEELVCLKPDTLCSVLRNPCSPQARKIIEKSQPQEQTYGPHIQRERSP